MSLITNPRDKLILALDGMDSREVFALLEKLPDLRWVKVGLELFVSAGPQIISDLREHGLSVFLDLKFHDIPITMAGACRKAARTGASLISVHASAGRDALLEAKAAASEGAAEVGLTAPSLLAVTVLTSWNAKKFSDQLFIDQPLQKRVEFLSVLASESDMDGCICSPLEVSALRRIHPASFELVTPGIRMKDSDLNDDQVRVLSPSEAISQGASRLVVGRPITYALQPAVAFERFVKELECNYFD